MKKRMNEKRQTRRGHYLVSGDFVTSLHYANPRRRFLVTRASILDVSLVRFTGAISIRIPNVSSRSNCAARISRIHRGSKPRKRAATKADAEGVKEEE